MRAVAILALSAFTGYVIGAVTMIVWAGYNLYEGPID